MYFKNFFSCLYVGQVNNYLSVKSAGTQQRAVKNVGSVRRRHDDDALVFLKAVHLNQQLVQGLLSFVVSAAETGTSLSAHRVDFVDEHDARSIFLCLVERITDTGSTDADIEFNEVRTAYLEKRNARFSRRCACKICLTRSRAADHQYTSRNTRSEVGESFRVFKKIDNFRQFFFFLVRSRNVLKHDFCF